LNLRLYESRIDEGKKKENPFESGSFLGAGRFLQAQVSAA
jgi:hypothetical protein